jgi:hypothetical protein
MGREHKVIIDRRRARGAYEDGDPRRLIIQVAIRTNTPIREVIEYDPRDARDDR